MTDSALTASARKVDWDTSAPACPAEDGIRRITDHATAQAVLRSYDTVQAGFGADDLGYLPAGMRRPVLYQDGPEHREQRRQIARFFTPKHVDAHYRDMMNRLADDKIRQLLARGRADLDRLSFALAVEIAAAVIGLTNSRPGTARRLERFFTDPPDPRNRLLIYLYVLYRQHAVRSFNRKDVLPAIKARRRRRADDVISFLIDQGCTNGEILTECITFAPAGMITTREFINVAAWHLFTDDTLRERYRAGNERERVAILNELLRLEPVVNTLRRRTTAPIQAPDQGTGATTIPAGCLVDISVATANVDPHAMGVQSHAIRVGRPLADGVKEHGLSFGDGPHKCPGSHIALLETDIFLHKLFALDGLRLVSSPAIGFKKEFFSYELRGLKVVAEPHR